MSPEIEKHRAVCYFTTVLAETGAKRRWYVGSLCGLKERLLFMKVHRSLHEMSKRRALAFFQQLAICSCQNLMAHTQWPLGGAYRLLEMVFNARRMKPLPMALRAAEASAAQPDQRKSWAALAKASYGSAMEDDVCDKCGGYEASCT